jgi:hypothetical protein
MGGLVSAIDVTTGTITDFANSSTRPSGTSYWAGGNLALDPAGTTAYFTDHVDDGPPTLFSLDLSSGTRSVVSSILSDPSGGVHITDDGGEALVLERTSPDQIVRFDLGTGNITGTIPTGTNFAPAFFVNGPTAFLMTHGGEVTALDLSSGASNVVASGLLYPTDLVVFNTAGGTMVSAQPTDAATETSPVTLTFDSITAPGDTTLELSATGPAVPSGFQLGSPATWYEISTTATFDGNVVICIDYSGVSYGDESTLQLLHYEDGLWVNVTTNRDPATSTICGVVSSFSPFVVVEFPAMGLLTDLINRVENLDVKHGILMSLDSKLSAAKQALGDIIAGNDAAAINAVQAFVSATQAQSGIQIPMDVANGLIDDALVIIGLLQ